MTEPPLDIECLKSPRSREEARDGRQNPAQGREAVSGRVPFTRICARMQKPKTKGMYPPKEAARRRDTALGAALGTPPKPRPKADGVEKPKMKGKKATSAP